MAKKPEPKITRVNVAMWMTSFSDLLSLLLCFFVMLLTMRAMDDQKFEDALTGFGGAFGVLGKTAEAGIDHTFVVPIGPPVPDQVTNSIDDALAQRFLKRGLMRRMAGAVVPPEPKAYEHAFETERYLDRLVTRIDALFLFEPDRAELSEASRLLLEDVAISLRGEPGRVRIEAFVAPEGVEGERTAETLAIARVAAAATALVRDDLLPAWRVVAMGRGEATPDTRNASIAEESLVLTVEFYRAPAFKVGADGPSTEPNAHDAFDPLAPVKRKRPAHDDSAEPSGDGDDDDSPASAGDHPEEN